MCGWTCVLCGAHGGWGQVRALPPTKLAEGEPWAPGHSCSCPARLQTQASLHCQGPRKPLTPACWTVPAPAPWPLPSPSTHSGSEQSCGFAWTLLEPSCARAQGGSDTPTCCHLSPLWTSGAPEHGRGAGSAEGGSVQNCKCLLTWTAWVPCKHVKGRQVPRQDWESPQWNHTPSGQRQPEAWRLGC